MRVICLPSSGAATATMQCQIHLPGFRWRVGTKTHPKQFTKNCTRMPKNNNYQWQVVVVFVLDTSGCRVARTATCCFQEHRILCSTHVLKPTLSSSLSLSFTNSDLLVVTFPFFVLLNVSDETCHRWAGRLTAVMSNQQQKMNWHFAGSVWCHTHREREREREREIPDRWMLMGCRRLRKERLMQSVKGCVWCNPRQLPYTDNRGRNPGAGSGVREH